MNRDPRGYYAALHVTPDATAAEIQHAFRALMRLRHPDVEAAARAGTGAGAGNDDGDEARRILESFAVLRDPRSRSEYDPATTTATATATSSTAAAAPTAVPGRTAPGGREIPVRHHRQERPVLRVTPVRWERGPL